MIKIDKIALIVATAILSLCAIGCVSKNRNNQSSEDGIERENDEIVREAEAEVPYSFHFISKDLIEVLDRDGNPIRYNPAASGTSVGDEVEEYRQLAAYGFYAFSIAEGFDEFPMEKLDRYARYVFKAPLTTDSDIDNPLVKSCINDAYRLEQSNGKMDQNFLLDKEGSSKAYNTENRNGDLHYVYVEKGNGGGTVLRSEIVRNPFNKHSEETSLSNSYSRSEPAYSEVVASDLTARNSELSRNLYPATKADRAVESAVEKGANKLGVVKEQVDAAKAAVKEGVVKGKEAVQNAASDVKESAKNAAKETTTDATNKVTDKANAALDDVDDVYQYHK